MAYAIIDLDIRQGLRRCKNEHDGWMVAYRGYKESRSMIVNTDTPYTHTITRNDTTRNVRHKDMHTLKVFFINAFRYILPVTTHCRLASVSNPRSFLISGNATFTIETSST